MKINNVSYESPESQLIIVFAEKSVFYKIPQSHKEAAHVTIKKIKSLGVPLNISAVSSAVWTVYSAIVVYVLSAWILEKHTSLHIFLQKEIQLI